MEPSPFFPSFIHDDEDLAFPLGFPSPSPLDLFESVTDLVKIEKSPSSCKYQLVVRRRAEPEYPLQYLCDRVSELEIKFERLVGPKGRDSDRKYKLTKEIKGSGERKYKWEAEIQGPPGRKYKWEAAFEGPGERKYTWTTEVKGGKKDVVALKKAKAKAEAMAKMKKKKSYNWTTELKSERENGEMQHTYTIKASSGGEKKEKKEKKKEKPRVVEIEEDEEEHGAILLRKVSSIYIVSCFYSVYM